MKHKLLSVIFATIATAMLLSHSALHAQQSPTITIENDSSDFVLAKLRGPTSGYLSIPAGGKRTGVIRGGNYVALFRYGDGGHYSYTRVGPFWVTETPTEVSEITIVLHTVAGNTNEEPSNQNEFNQ
jgi:hypothetical protein